MDKDNRNKNGHFSFPNIFNIIISKVQVRNALFLLAILLIITVLVIISKPAKVTDNKESLTNNNDAIEVITPLPINEASENEFSSEEATEEEIENDKKVESLAEYFSQMDEYDQMLYDYNLSVDEYNATIDQLEEQNEILDSGIKAAQAAIEDKRTPFDLNTRIQLRNALRDSQNHFTEIPARIEPKASMEKTIPEDTSPEKLELSNILEEIVTVNDAISILSEDQSAIKQSITELPTVPDNSELSNNLIKLAGEYLDSIEVLEQVTYPNEAFITERLSRIPAITGMQAVTPDHDPNEHLGKPGWYTSCIYFTVSYIDPETVKGADIVDKGTIAGGAIEVFKTHEDAQNREKDLSAYDDTLISPGSRYIVGSILIRASKKLTYDQQVDLTLEIANEFTRLD